MEVRETVVDSAELRTLGIDEEKLEVLKQRAGKEVAEGLLPSAQVAVAKDGRVVFTATYAGSEDHGPDTLYCVFSSTKAFTSTAAWLLIESGDLDTRELVSDIIPEFGTEGKEVITVEQLFLHTAGFPQAPFSPLDWQDKARRLQRFAEWRLNYPPGRRFEYHPTSSMWVIAEIVERRSGQPFHAFVRNRIIEPLGIGDDCYVGLVPESAQSRVAGLCHVGETLSDEEYLAQMGFPRPPVGEVTEDAILSFNRPEIRNAGVPGGGGVMTASALALFYQGLLHGGLPGRPRIWQDETLRRGRTVISGDYLAFGADHTVDRALGLCIAGDDHRSLRGFGHLNSATAFGHGGAGGQIGWADPTTGISLAYCTGGHDRHPLRQGRRGVSLSNKAADLLA